MSAKTVRRSIDAVVVEVLEHDDAADRLARVLHPFAHREGRHLDHPQAAVGVEVHQDRILDERLLRDQLDVVAGRQDEGLQGLLGGERSRACGVRHHGGRSGRFLSGGGDAWAQEGEHERGRRHPETDAPSRRSRLSRPRLPDTTSATAH